MSNELMPLVALLIVVVVLVALASLRKLLHGRQGDGDLRQWPVYAKRLMTAREQQMFHRLQSAFPDHIVLAQVSLSQLIGVKKTDRSTYQTTLNRYRLLTADFVLCQKDFSVTAVFELDGRSHQHPKRSDSDQRKGEVLAAAGIRLFRLNSADLPSAVELRTMVDTLPEAV